MNNTNPLAIIGGIIIVVSIGASFLASNVQNNIIPDHFLEVRSGDYFAVTLPFTNNNATMVEAMDVNTSLIVAAELSLVKYEFGEPKQEGNLTMIGTGRVKNSTCTIEYKDLVVYLYKSGKISISAANGCLEKLRAMISREEYHSAKDGLR